MEKLSERKALFYQINTKQMRVIQPCGRNEEGFGTKGLNSWH